MTTVYDVPADRFIRTLAAELKKKPEIKPPEWAAFVKTGTHKEMPPQDPDWWFVRVASIMRRVYIDGPMGVQRMRTFYGGSKNMGSRPDRFRKGSGSILRKSLQQLEAAGFVQHDKTGRKITPAGASFMDGVANQMARKPAKAAAAAE
jgi:small subunit ribosomal protein S19e